ncbi:MAG TPA: hypothetical protein VIK10_09020 [Prolixibacteraceae bacterium]
MSLATLLYTEHQIIKMVHTLISMTFLIVAIWLFYRSISGFYKNWTYGRLDKFLAYAFIVNLYLQLIFGFFLMASPAIVPGQEVVSQDITMKLATRRFWPMEHIVLMLFALFIANLGLIFSNSAQVDKEKYRKVTVYYALAVVLIILSLGSTFLE